MVRILYFSPAAGFGSGGNKVMFRHVEALCAMGYDARVRTPDTANAPTWFDHAAPIEDHSRPIDPTDILVMPEDYGGALEHCADLPNRKVVFCQNPYALTGAGFGRASAAIRDKYRTFMACGHGMAGLIARYFPYDLISVVPAFADERLFRPAPKVMSIACTPRKRPVELASIRFMFERLHPGAEAWRWTVLRRVSEAEVAAAMGEASVFLSLARLEAMSLTTLEAMACECLIAGFTGIGPREYTNSINGLWVDEDDCEAAAQALVLAVRMAESGGGAAALMRHAARETAARYTHAGFQRALAGFWRDQMGVAP